MKARDLKRSNEGRSIHKEAKNSSNLLNSIFCFFVNFFRLKIEACTGEFRLFSAGLFGWIPIVYFFGRTSEPQPDEVLEKDRSKFFQTSIKGIDGGSLRAVQINGDFCVRFRVVLGSAKR